LPGLVLEPGSCCNYVCLLLTMQSSCCISVLSLLVLLICLASLRGYVGGHHEDLSIQDLEHVARVVGGDSRMGDLEREVVRGRHTVDLAAVSHE
jgi:hypothetical protein